MSGQTIKLEPATKAQLNKLKIHPHETYNDVVKRLTFMAIDREPVDEDLAEQLRTADTDVVEGRLVDFDAVCDELGL